MSSHFSSTWRAIADEASLAAEHICIGVTALGRANYAQRAYYAEAFFALSVGLERSAKLAIVLDRAIDGGGEFPDEQAYRRFGHRLRDLMGEAAAIGKRRSREAPSLPDSDIQKAMLSVLTDFASNVTRYYNLDLLSGTTAAEAPIAAWDRQVTQRVLDAHDTKRTREHRERNAEAVGALMDSFAFVRHESESGAALHSAGTAALRTGELELARRWERVYLLQLGRFIYGVMGVLTGPAQAALEGQVPYLNEFFAIFGNDDDYFRSRKTWSIYH